MEDRESERVVFELSIDSVRGEWFQLLVMKRLLIPTILVTYASSAPGALILSVIYDGSNNSPKGVEIYVTTGGSYEGWTLDFESNAISGFSVGYTFDTTSYTVGDFIYVTSTSSDPVITGAGGIVISDASFNQNGNDRLRITNGTDVIDQYGVSGTDGSGSAWEYLDSFAIRESGTTASGGFVLGDWTVAPINTLDPSNAPLVAALGTYTPPIGVPEPSSALLGSFALLGLLRRRREIA